MNEIRIPDVVDVEWAREEMERTGKKNCNKGFVYYVKRANENINWIDLSKLPRKKYNKKIFIDWKNVNNEVIALFDKEIAVLKLVKKNKYKSNYTIRIKNNTNDREMDIYSSSIFKIALGKLFRDVLSDYPKLKELFPLTWNEVKGMPVNGHTEVYPICPRCKKIKSIRIRRLVKQGLGCCGPKSAGELYVKHVLINNKEKFEEQFTFEECRNERKLPFDFYLPNRNILIEVQGVQHRTPTFGIDSFHKTKENDKIKKDYCKDNNIELIELNYESFDFINLDNEISKKTHFLKTDYNNFNFNVSLSQLSSGFDLEEIKRDYLKGTSYKRIALKHNTTPEIITSLTKKMGIYKKRVFKNIDIDKIRNMYVTRNVTAKKIGELMGVSEQTIRRNLKENNIKKEQNYHISKKVRCINTGEVFNSLSNACEWSGLKRNSSKIGDVCKGKAKSAGKHPITGEKLHWEYVD